MIHTPENLLLPIPNDLRIINRSAYTQSQLLRLTTLQPNLLKVLCQELMVSTQGVWTILDMLAASKHGYNVLADHEKEEFKVMFINAVKFILELPAEQLGEKYWSEFCERNRRNPKKIAKLTIAIFEIFTSLGEKNPLLKVKATLIEEKGKAKEGRLALNNATAVPVADLTRSSARTLASHSLFHWQKLQGLSAEYSLPSSSSIITLPLLCQPVTSVFQPMAKRQRPSILPSTRTEGGLFNLPKMRPAEPLPSLAEVLSAAEQDDQQFRPSGPIIPPFRK